MYITLQRRHLSLKDALTTDQVHQHACPPRTSVLQLVEGNRLPFRREMHRRWRAVVSYLEHTHHPGIPQSAGTLTFGNAGFSVRTPHGHLWTSDAQRHTTNTKGTFTGASDACPILPLGTHVILGRILNAVQFVRIHSSLVCTNSFQFEGKSSIWKHNEKN